MRRILALMMFGTFVIPTSENCIEGIAFRIGHPPPARGLSHGKGQQAHHHLVARSRRECLVYGP
jgi:hypothetical protein